MQDNNTQTSIRIPGYVVCLLAAISAISEFFRTLPGSWLGDLGSFIESSWAVGARANPYAVYPMSLKISLPGYEFWNPNLNPPISILFFKLFTFAPPESVFRQWYLVSALIYAGLTWLMVRRFSEVPARLVVFWMFSLAAFWDNQNLGQIYVPVFSAGILAWLLLERGGRRAELLAGCAIGVMVSMKPQFMIWPLLLMLGWHFRVAVSAFMTALILAIIPVLLYGAQVYSQWTAAVSEGLASRISFVTNASLPGLFARIGMYHVGLAISVIFCALLCFWAFWKRPDVMRLTSLGLVAALVTSPLAWMQYHLILIPLLLSRWRDERFRLVAFSLAVPVPLVLVTLGREDWIRFTVGSIYSWSMIFLLVMLVQEEYQRCQTAENIAGSE